MMQFLHAWGWIIVPASLMYAVLLFEWIEEREKSMKKSNYFSFCPGCGHEYAFPVSRYGRVHCVDCGAEVRPLRLPKVVRDRRAREAEARGRICARYGFTLGAVCGVMEDGAWKAT